MQTARAPCAARALTRPQPVGVRLPGALRTFRKAKFVPAASDVTPIDQAKEAAVKGKAAVEDFASKVVGKDIKMPAYNLNVDLKSLVTYNFIAQFFLTAVSWAVVFFTTHTQMAKGASISPTTAVLMVGVVLAGYSAYQSYTYFTKVKSAGLDVLDSWDMLKKFYDHMTLNFVGAGAAIMALQAQVGSMMMSSMTQSTAAALKLKVQESSADLATEALAQAASNTLLAHIVSLVFLTVMVRKVTDAYKKLLDWSENLRKSLPNFN